MEITIRNRRKTKVVVGLGDISGVLQYGKRDVGVARAPLESILFSNAVYMGLTNFIAFLVPKILRTTESC